MIVLVHPSAGLLSFDDSDIELAHRTADDIGEMYDLNEIGTLKSRVVLCWEL